jgi:hypothetical protein
MSQTDLARRGAGGDQQQADEEDRDLTPVKNEVTYEPEATPPHRMMLRRVRFRHDHSFPSSPRLPILPAAVLLAVR